MRLIFCKTAWWAADRFQMGWEKEKPEGGFNTSEQVLIRLELGELGDWRVGWVDERVVSLRP
jgi:hypothetical protein